MGLIQLSLVCLISCFLSAAANINVTVIIKHDLYWKHIC